MIQIHPVVDKKLVWERFGSFHYLKETLNVSARCWVAAWDGDLVAFTSAITMPSGTLQNAWREHRTVVIPDYQGLGLGAVLTDWLGQTLVDEGKRFYSRTTHPRLAAYRRSRPDLWRETKKSGKQRKPGWHSWTHQGKEHAMPMNYTDDRRRLAYSFEYIGLQDA